MYRNSEKVYICPALMYKKYLLPNQKYIKNNKKYIYQDLWCIIIRINYIFEKRDSPDDPRPPVQP